MPLGFEVELCRPMEALSEQFAELRQLEEKSGRTEKVGARCVGLDETSISRSEKSCKSCLHKRNERLCHGLRQVL